MHEGQHASLCTHGSGYEVVDMPRAHKSCPRMQREHLKPLSNVELASFPRHDPAGSRNDSKNAAAQLTSALKATNMQHACTDHAHVHKGSHAHSSTCQNVKANHMQCNTVRIQLHACAGRAHSLVRRPAHRTGQHDWHKCSSCKALQTATALWLQKRKPADRQHAQPCRTAKQDSCLTMTGTAAVLQQMAHAQCLSVRTHA